MLRPPRQQVCHTKLDERGVPSANAPSTLAFSVAMEAVRQIWLQQAPKSAHWEACVDDTVIIVPPQLLDQCWTLGVQALGTHGFTANARKTRVWVDPHLVSDDWRSCVQPRGSSYVAYP